MIQTNTQSDYLEATLNFTDTNGDTLTWTGKGTWKQVNDNIIKLREFMSIWGYREQ
jgi:DNA-binding protein H-NS